MIREINKKLKNLFDSQIASYLAEVDYEREDTTPIPKNITSGATKNMFPEIFIDTNQVEFEYITLGNKPDIIYTIEITVMLKTNEKDKIEGWCSNYIEAIYRMLEENKIEDTTNQYLESANIVDLNTKDSVYYKAVGIILKIRQGE